MYKLRHNFTSRFDNRAWLHPHGTTNFDYQAIPKRRDVALEQFKNRVRKENYIYLSNHPEIHGMISLFLKKLLVIQPEDAAEYLAEYFTTRLKGSNDFEEQLNEEMKKISRYHVTKMRNAGKINLKPTTTVQSEASGEEWVPELDANFFKKMNIGPLAVDFSFDPSCLMSIKKKKEEEEAKKKLRRKKKKPRKYCGCKDWKLKKNRAVTAESEGGRTFSTLGNVDTLQTSEEETEEEEIEGEDEELTEMEAERIASQLVNSFIRLEGFDSGVATNGQDGSFETMKNIQ